MKTLFNKFMMAMVAVVMIIGFSAFKMVENFYNNTDSGWYIIDTNPLNPDDPDNQHIVDFEGQNAPEGVECNIEKTIDPCQVELDLSNFTSTTPITQMTVSEAVAAGAVVVNYAHKF